MSGVRDTDRIKHPYQSVGKLLYKKRGELRGGTAFAVSVKGSKNIIFTSARNLSDENGKATDIFFIPALKNNGDEPYKTFRQIDGGQGRAWFVHQNWDPITKPRTFDLGAIRLARNSRNKDIGDEVALLDVDFDLEISPETRWSMVWYSQLRMISSKVRYRETVGTGKVVVGDSDSADILHEEAHGAPWILPNNTVNGHYAGSTVKSATSPYYTQGLIEQVLNQM